MSTFQRTSFYSASLFEPNHRIQRKSGAKPAWLFGTIMVALTALLGAVTASAQSGQSGAGEHEHHHQHHAAVQPTDTAPKIVPVSSLPVPHLQLVTDSGKMVDLAEEIAGTTPVYVNFIYTSCTSVCPVMSNTFSALGAALKQRGTPARLVSISIDPDYDTPTRLSAYAANFRTDADWLFLTGSVEASVAAQKAFGVYKTDKMAHEVTTFFRPSGCSRWLRVQGFAKADDLAALMDPAAQLFDDPPPHD